ncbi:uncharacterized protein METZ01_LOCUS200479 [marine metagenome]|uniref:Uncharacterized protein n=1 Tax=marine metagenome TaxID=408172 RepID=A0A382EAW9_9ZZZZ
MIEGIVIGIAGYLILSYVILPLF